MLFMLFMLPILFMLFMDPMLEELMDRSGAIAIGLPMAAMVGVPVAPKAGGWLYVDPPNEEDVVRGARGKLKPVVGAALLFALGGGASEKDDELDWLMDGRWALRLRLDIDGATPVVDDAQGLAVVALDAEAQGFAALCGLLIADPIGAGCNGCENCVAEGVMASNLARSGVTVLKDGAGLMADMVGLGVDHENAGAETFRPGDAAVAGAAEVSQPASMGSLEWRLDFPLTNAAKSASEAPFVVSKALPGMPPKDMKSSLLEAVPPLVAADSCWSFSVCSSSTLLERVLINSMNDWNCLRSSKGPRLMFQRIGRMSTATKSASATSPTTLRTFRAATITAGSFVLIALIRGTIFSCMVYLSSTLEDDVFFFSLPIPSRPSAAPDGSLLPPHRKTNACRPRTLMARLLVLLKTVAMTGKSSFLMVLKSSTDRTIGRLRMATSTIAGVGLSTAVTTMGNTSEMSRQQDRNRAEYGLSAHHP